MDSQHHDDIERLFRDNDNIGSDSNVLLRPMRQLLDEGKTLGPMSAFTFKLPGEGLYPFGVLTWTKNNRLVFWPILPKCQTMENIIDHVTLEFPSKRSHFTYYIKDGSVKHKKAADLSHPTAWQLVPFPNTGIALWFAMSVKTSVLLEQDMAVQRLVPMPKTDRKRRVEEYVRHFNELNLIDVNLPPDQLEIPPYICCNFYLVTDPNGNFTLTSDAFVQAWKNARIDGWDNDVRFLVQPSNELEFGGHKLVIATACPPGECTNEVDIGIPRPIEQK